MDLREAAEASTTSIAHSVTEECAVHAVSHYDSRFLKNYAPFPFAKPRPRHASCVSVIEEYAIHSDVTVSHHDPRFLNSYVLVSSPLSMDLTVKPAIRNNNR